LSNSFLEWASKVERISYALSFALSRLSAKAVRPLMLRVKHKAKRIATTKCKKIDKK